MRPLGNLNLIHLLDFYLAATCLTSVFLRVRQYGAVLALVRAVPGRWPRLFRLVRKQHTVVLRGSTALPGLLALGLTMIQLATSRVAWPALTHHEAKLTIATLARHGPVCAVVALLGLAMLATDGYQTFVVADVDRAGLEKSFDQAEFWLRSWAGPMVRAVTFGYVDPRQHVATAVQTALVEARQILSTTLWWLAVQVGVRLAFALALWGACAAVS
jgi:hypothetical protein